AASSRADDTLYAYLPTAEHWDLLVSAMATASDSEGDISLGPGWAKPMPGVVLYQLVRSSDGGATWTDLPAAALPGMAAYPSSIAPGLLALAGREKQGLVRTGLLRYPRE